MLIGEAKAVARQWVEEEASSIAGFSGAFLTGSISWSPEDAEFPPTSDIDIKLTLDTLTVPGVPKKLLYRGVVLDVSYAALEEVRSAEAVLANYYLAGHFLRPSIIADPSGHLRDLQRIVAREYARREWVTKRCEHAQDWLLTRTQLDDAAPIHDQVYAWLYAIICPAHIVLVADLQNPTIRKVLVASGDVLARYGHRSLHETVLGLLGSAAMSRTHVEALLTSCAAAFDTAQEVVTTPFIGVTNVTDFFRPMAIDGAQELITAGFPREAVLWVAITHTNCQKALQNGAPDDVRDRYAPSYARLLAELGIGGSHDLRERMNRLRDLVPEVMEVAAAIIAANPAIAD